MPQEHCVLKCFSCETFQAHIVKKAKKWECKVCRVKQSLKRNYGKGSGLDCRKQVMKLNELRLTKRYNSEFLKDVTDDSNENFTEEYLNVEKPVISKWAVYLEADEPVSDSKTDFPEILDKDERAEKAPAYCYPTNKNICTRSVKTETKDFDSSPSNQGNLYSFHKSIEKIQVEYPFELKDESNACKQEKKNIEEKDKSYVIKINNKNSNIFESDLSDLDDILNL